MSLNLSTSVEKEKEVSDYIYHEILLYKIQNRKTICWRGTICIG